MSKYHEMPPDARVWIYQAERAFEPVEQIQLERKLALFVRDWTSHSNALEAYAEIRYNRFIIIMVDEAKAVASGCSIDKAFHLIKELETEIGQSLTNRMKFGYKIDNIVHVVSKQEFAGHVANGEINDQTIVFNNLAQSKEQLENAWEIPYGKSWHRQIFTTVP
jgi:hypothetical protein